MKMKRFFSGILAAVMSVAIMAVPLSTAIAEDETNSTAADEKCTITIKNAASTGTYTAYPIFVGDVEMETETDSEGKTTSRMVIDNPTFHKNLDTKLTEITPITNPKSYKIEAGVDETNGYGLFTYLKSDNKINSVGFLDMLKAYDPYQSYGSFSMGNPYTVSQQAEGLANLLNLTSSDSAVNTTLGSGRYSAFYSAFAEAARMFMIDNIGGTLTGTATGTLASGKVTIEVDEPGYYLVEYTPADYEDNSADYEKTPRAVRRSLVLVGKGEELSATIASKDTMNIASVDVTFNENILDKATCEGSTPTYSYPTGDGAVANPGAEDYWKKNVSAGNGDYVKCRVVVTLPGNYEDYDQYYLAVPIMYGYNATGSNDFDTIYNNQPKSITRQTGTTDKEENVKVYFLDDENKAVIDKSNFDILTSYTYADTDKDKGGSTVTQDNFKAADTFVFTDVKKINAAGHKELVIEFPVKFDRFNKDNALPDGVLSNLGFNEKGTDYRNYTGDDALMKNYITAKAVYSNNPNLKALKEDEIAYDSTNKDGVKLYLETSKDPGTLQNPVGIAKESSANIVTYRLRIHATTEELVNLSQAGGVEGIRFVLYDNKNNKYAEVTSLGAIATYDTVTGEILRDTVTSLPNSTNNTHGTARIYKITGWTDDYMTTTGEGESAVTSPKSNCVFDTYNTKGTTAGVWNNNNTARLEIVGLAPGDYTVIALDETIKTAEEYKNPVTATDAKGYALPKENNKPKTEYRFSFAPTLSSTCTKLLYNTHYAPIEGTMKQSDYDELSDDDKKAVTSIIVPDNYYDKTIAADNILITDYNMKWYDMTGKEIKKTEAEWWLGEREDVALMSMRVTYVKKGLSLPVTGGIGTLIFFAVGGALVVISTVAIVTKSRMKREQL